MWIWIAMLALLLAGCGEGFQATTGGGGAAGGDPSGPGGHGPGSGGAGAGGAGDGGSASSAGGGGGSGGGGTCEADLATDPLHCGSCAHSCLGAACMAGLCQPVQFSTELATTALAASNAAVVWGSAAGGTAADLDGSNQRTVPFGTTGGVKLAAASSGHTFFVLETDPTVRMLDAQASTVQVNHAAQNPVALAADDGAVYWADGASHVGVYWLDVTSLVETMVAFPQTEEPRALASADGLVCWVGGPNLRCAPKADGSGPGNVVVSSLDSPCGVAMGSGLYWIECPATGAYSTHSAHEDGSSPETLGTMSPAVATDGAHVYWVDHGELRRRPLVGGAAESRGVASTKVSHFAVGPDRAYFSNAFGIWWVAK